MSLAASTKRGFDLTVATLGVVVLAPLAAVIALAIRLESPGPVFFRQERVGRGGRLFRIHKFRTMVSDAASRGPTLTVGEDARITRVGTFLRRAKLDELPQLLDVIVGEMSLVGPRPELPRYVSHYPAALRDLVLKVRPGITDPASLAFADENQLLARAADPEREYLEVVMPCKLQAAADYARRATLATDIKVILRTLCLVARRSLRRGPG
jgi:lipopolysaccharide/colanic/teichoic acid biosynthesis glycosyltransferase